MLTNNSEASCILQQFDEDKQVWFPITGECRWSLLRGYKDVMQTKNPAVSFRIIKKTAGDWEVVDS